MKKIKTIALLSFASFALAAPVSGQTSDLRALSDEFENPASLGEWRHVYRAEGQRANQLAEFSIGRRISGWLTMTPHTSTWYRDFRGVLAFKPVTGDFLVITRLRTTNRAGQGAPQSLFSLAGLMVRAPRAITPATWRPGQENYIFLALGSANQPGVYQYEVKTTRQSDSQLEITPAPGGEAQLAILRVGAAFVALRSETEGAWTVHRRYSRPDLPAALQAGLTTYTDWSTVENMDPRVHNRTVVRAGRPDLTAHFDYVRYRRPQIPPALSGRDFADPRQVSDADLVALVSGLR